MNDARAALTDVEVDFTFKRLRFGQEEWVKVHMKLGPRDNFMYEMSGDPLGVLPAMHIVMASTAETRVEMQPTDPRGVIDPLLLTIAALIWGMPEEAPIGALRREIEKIPGAAEKLNKKKPRTHAFAFSTGTCDYCGMPRNGATEFCDVVEAA